MENTLYANKGTEKGPDNRLSPEKEQFFREGYLEMYPDVSQSGTDPWDHYVSQGRKEGRDSGLHPGADRFFAAGYLEMYPDAAGSGMDPWHHYVLIGKKEGRDNGLHPGAEQFFPDGYLAMYPDAAKSGMGPWHHYVLHGRKLGYDNGLHPGEDQFFAEGYAVMYPEAAEEGTDLWHHYASIGKKLGYDNGLHPDGSQFFAEGYTAMYQDVSESGLSPWEHYVRIGHKEGRDNGLNGCGNLFFSDGYLEMYPDVRESGEDAWHNYVTKGLAAGRDNGWHPDEGRFFAAGYLEMYPDVREIGEVAWHNYIREGKAKGRDNGWHPTRDLFLPDEYLELYPDVRESGENPWHHYVTKGKKEGRDSGHWLLSSEASEERIAEYWSRHSKSKKVVYTCLAGEYDHLINHHYLSDDYDYVCFTDNPALLRFRNYGVWQIRPLAFNALDNTRNNRWHKLHPHELFPEHEESIYVDSNINILTDYIFNAVKNTKKDFILPRHFQNDCIYDELKFIVQCGKDTAGNMKVLHDLYASEKLPHHLGFSENNLLYRKHHSKDVIKIMDMWWNMIEKYSRRDQASLIYVLWKNRIDIESCLIPNLRTDRKNFSVSSHLEHSNSYSLLQIDQYRKMIDEHAAVSFSIFDTLLLRPFLKRSDLFLFLERKEHKPGFARARIQAESDASLREGHDGCTDIGMIYDHMDVGFKPMLEKEEESDLQLCQPNPVIKELYDYALKQGKRVIAVSDSYYPGKLLTKLLEKSGYTGFDLVLSSCDEHAGKSDGELYKAALKKLECSPSDLLHIGSDPVNDGEKPSKLSISCAVIEKASEHLFEVNPRAMAFSRSYKEDRLASSIYLGILAINGIRAQEYASREEYFENLGYEYGGIAAWQFIKFVYENCLKSRIKDIAFDSGSGFTLKKVFDLFDRKHLNSHVIYIPESLSSLIPSPETASRDNPTECAEALRQEENPGKTADHSESPLAGSPEPAGAEKEKTCSQAKAVYLSCLSQFNYSSSKLAIVALSTELPKALRMFGAVYPEKKTAGYCWRKSGTEADKNAFDWSGESFGILEPWSFMEFLFSAPDPIVKDFGNCQPDHVSTGNEHEGHTAAICSCVSDGIVRFVKDAKRIFGETDISFSPLMTSCLIQALSRNPSADDRKFMRSLSLPDCSNGTYKRAFRLW